MKKILILSLLISSISCGVINTEKDKNKSKPNISETLNNNDLNNNGNNKNNESGNNNNVNSGKINILVDQMMEPYDIIWTNIGGNRGIYIFRQILIYVMVFVVLFFLTMNQIICKRIIERIVPAGCDVVGTSNSRLGDP